jgi:thioredoxin-like negative regulator of GroEL
MKILRFSALWCPDCIVMVPVWQKALAGFTGNLIDFDADDNQAELEAYKVKSLPQLVAIDDDGREVGRLVGMQDEEDIREFVGKYF